MIFTNSTQLWFLTNYQLKYLLRSFNLLKTFTVIAFNISVEYLLAKHSQINKNFLNSDKCGIGKMSSLVEKDSLKYQSRYKRSLRVHQGRDAHVGEFPFVVGMKTFYDESFRCSGSIIHPKWILTAAHCADYMKPWDLHIYVGYTTYPIKGDKYYKLEKIVRHPKYPKRDLLKAYPKYDIALLELETPIIYDMKKHFYKVNSICLPKNDILNIKEEFAMFSGWGQLDVDLKNKRQLQAMNLKLYAIDSCQDTRNYNWIICYNNKDKSNPRPGDSGGPLIQYVDGRAVIIGVAHGDVDPDRLKNQTYCPDGSNLFIRVSKFIDFINKTVNK